MPRENRKRLGFYPNSRPVISIRLQCHTNKSKGREVAQFKPLNNNWPPILVSKAEHLNSVTKSSQLFRYLRAFAPFGEVQKPHSINWPFCLVPPGPCVCGESTLTHIPKTGHLSSFPPSLVSTVEALQLKRSCRPPCFYGESP